MLLVELAFQVALEQDVESNDSTQCSELSDGFAMPRDSEIWSRKTAFHKILH
jgi:hypothetical protein